MLVRRPVKDECSGIIVIRNEKIWKHGPYYWYFSLNWKYLEWLYSKNGNFCEEQLSENDFEAVLATFYCYKHGAKVSEAVQKIAKDQKEYRKCSLCVIICWIAKIYLSITEDRQLQIKKSIANAPCVLVFAEQPKYTYQSIAVKNGWLQGDLRCS